AGRRRATASSPGRAADGSRARSRRPCPSIPRAGEDFGDAAPGAYRRQMAEPPVATPASAPAPAPVRVELADGLLRVTLDRADKKNALTQPMYGALADALIRAGSDPDVRVVLLQSTGDAFCAGNDLADFGLGADGESHTMRFLRELAATTVPLVIAVQGVAVGVGTTMLLHADLVHAAAGARFRMPFVDLGLVPEA